MYRIIIDIIFNQIQIAFLNNEVLEYYFIERREIKGNYGNIYMGRVEQIKPGIQGAFIKIDSEKNGLLHNNEIAGGKKASIDQLLKKGQEIIVQVKKESIEAKGAKLTTKLSISGHYLVLLPTENKIYCSKKIRDEKERMRLKSIVKEIKPKNCGIIIRTEAEGVGSDLLKKDLSYLVRRLEKVNDFEIAPKLLLREEYIITKIMRDYYNEEIEQIIVNSQDAYDELQEYLKFYFPERLDSLQLVNHVNLMDYYGLNKEIKKLHNRKIYLESGGYILIDYTETCTVIDINSGSFVGRNQEETFMKINLEASEIIAQQLRLRNIGGIIIIDYINIGGEKEQNKIIKVLNSALREDKMQTKIYGFTGMGMLHMTRKQRGRSLKNIYYEDCKACSGLGYIPNQESLFYNSIYLIECNKEILKNGTITAKVNPSLKNILDSMEGTNKKESFIEKLKVYYNVKIILEEDRYLDTWEIKLLPRAT